MPNDATNARAGSPYKGLQPYTEADHKYFFGRERDTERVASNLFVVPLTVLYGTSGVGKSSVLQAGVIPRLRKEPRAAVVYFNRWQGEAFAQDLKAQVLKAACEAAKVSPEAALRKVAESLELKRTPDATTVTFDQLALGCAAGLRLRVLIIFDQFEEYFLYHTSDAGSPKGFDAEFARAVNDDDGSVNFILAMREEELSKLDRFRQRIPNLLSNLLRLENLDRRSATRAVVRPLKVYNREHAGARKSIETRLVRAILREVNPERLSEAGGGQASSQTTAAASATAAARQPASRIETPFLQMVLTRLWEEEGRLGSDVLRLNTLETLGGARNIARTHLDNVMGRLTDSEQSDAASVLRFLVTPGGTKIAQTPSALASWADLPAPRVERVLTHLSAGPDVRILRKVSVPMQEDRYELFHDVLGPAILDWRARYVEARRAAAAQAEAAEALQSEREEKLLAQKRANKFRLATLGFAVLLAIMVAVAIYAFRQRAYAEEQRTVAEQKTVEALTQQRRAEEQTLRADDQAARAEAERQSAVAAREDAESQRVEAEKQRDAARVSQQLAEAQKRRADTQARIAAARTREVEIAGIKGEALIALKEKEPEKAIEHLRTLRALYQRDKDRSGEAYALAAIGEIHKAKTAEIYPVDFMLQQVGGTVSPPDITDLSSGGVEIEDFEKFRSEYIQRYGQALAAVTLSDKLSTDEKKVVKSLKSEADQALSFYNQALDINRANVKSDKDEKDGQILNEIGDLTIWSVLINSIDDEEKGGGAEAVEHALKGELEKSLDFYNRSRTAYHKADVPLEEARVLKKVADLLSTMGSEISNPPGSEVAAQKGDGGEDAANRQRVISYYSQAHEAYTRAGRPLTAASMLLRIGGIYYDLPKTDPFRAQLALGAYNQAHRIFREERRYDIEAPTDEKIAALHEELPEIAGFAPLAYEEARLAYHRAAMTATGDPDAFLKKEGEMLGKGWNLRSEHSGKASAESYFEGLVSESEGSGDPLEKARLLSLMAEFFGTKPEERPTAIKYYERERRAWGEVAARAGHPDALLNEGAALDKLGHLYEASSDTAKAIKAFDEERAVYAKVDPQAKGGDGKLVLPQTTNRLMSVAQFYEKQGDKAKMADAYEEALRGELLDTGTFSYNNAVTTILNALGKHYIDAGDEARAKELFDRVTTTYHKRGNTYNEISVLMSTGSLYKAAGKKTEATAYYEKARAVAREAKSMSGVLNALNAVGMLQGEAAAGYYQSVVDTSRAAGDEVTAGAALEALAEQARVAKDVPGTLKYYEEARAAYGKAHLGSQELSVLRTMFNIYSYELKDKAMADKLQKEIDELSSRVR